MFLDMLLRLCGLDPFPIETYDCSFDNFILDEFCVADYEVVLPTYYIYDDKLSVISSPLIQIFSLLNPLLLLAQPDMFIIIIDL